MALHAEAVPSSRWSRLLSSVGIRPRREAAVPAGMRVYTVGDIHGCRDQLDRLHAKIAEDGARFDGEKQLIYLGDYIDRGPDSRGVIEHLLTRTPEGFSPRFLKGNHEAALLDFLASASSYRAWRNYGAPETLLSYGVRPPLFDSMDMFEAARDALADALPASHLQFLRTLKTDIVIADYAFVHAGIRPGLSIDEQSEQDLLWIREEFVNCNSPHDKVIVHGHTPVASPLDLHNRIAVDTGVYATGVLSCVVLEGTGRRFIQAGRR
jgi:serine/threonine protein phosphatase 1